MFVYLVNHSSVTKPDLNKVTHFIISLPSKKLIYNKDYSSIIDICFYETFSTFLKLLAQALNSLDTRSDIRIKALMFLF